MLIYTGPSGCLYIYTIFNPESQVKIRLKQKNNKKYKLLYCNNLCILNFFYSIFFVFIVKFFYKLKTFFAFFVVFFAISDSEIFRYSASAVSTRVILEGTLRIPD